MSAVNDILNRVSMDQLAAELGTDTDTAEQAARGAIATLMTGMQSNAGDPDGEMSLAGALNQHASNGLFNTDSIDLSQVDTGDGAKIVQHVLGNQEQQSQALGAAGLGGLLGGGAGNKLLSTLAPIVLGYLASQVVSGKYGDILGSILGGGNKPQAQPQPQPSGGGGGILGGILGQILGGGGAPQPSTQGNSGPFNFPNQPDPGEQQFPTSNPQPAEQPGGGGILGGILGSILGKK